MNVTCTDVTSAVYRGEGDHLSITRRPTHYTYKEKAITAYRGSDHGHVTLHLRASVRDLLHGESGAL